MHPCLHRSAAVCSPQTFGLAVEQMSAQPVAAQCYKLAGMVRICVSSTCALPCLTKAAQSDSRLS